MSSPKPIKVISSEPIGISAYYRELVQYRHLIKLFAVQEFKLQYAQTRLNFLWAVLKPLMVMALFTFVFDRLIKIPGLLYPYPLFAFAGLMIWNNFSYMVTNGGSVILSNQALIRKMYFPRLLLLISKVIISQVEVAVSIMLILLLMWLLGYAPTYRIFFLPVFIAIGLLAGLTVAVWLNVVNIKYRDLNQFMPTLIGFLVWLTPVFYPVTLVPRDYAYILYLNPVSAAIQGCRWAILGDALPSIYYLPSIAACLVMLIAGLVLFVRAEVELVDHL